MTDFMQNRGGKRISAGNGNGFPNSYLLQRQRKIMIQSPNHQNISKCEECISGSMRYITSSYMATAFGSRPPWSSLHGLGEDSTASLNIRVLRPKIEWFRLRCSLHHKSCIETKYLRVYRVVLYHLTPSLAGIKLFAGYQPYLAVGKYARWAYD